MARASKAVSKKATGSSIATIDQEMSAAALAISDQIGQAGGNRIKLEASGDFLLPEGINIGDEVQFIIVDFVSRNSFYPVAYNPNNPTPPDCYAIGRVINDMAPEDDSPAVQSDSCTSCPLNQFGSGSNGQSKACKNERRVAVLYVDPDNPDAHNQPDAPIYELAITPTSLKSFDNAVRTAVHQLNGPPVKAIFTVTTTPRGTYAVQNWRDPVVNPDYAAHWGRRGEIEQMLFRKPDFSAAAAAAPARRGKAAPARRAAGGRR